MSYRVDIEGNIGVVFNIKEYFIVANFLWFIETKKKKKDENINFRPEFLVCDRLGLYIWYLNISELVISLKYNNHSLAVYNLLCWPIKKVWL